MAKTSRKSNTSENNTASPSTNNVDASKKVRLEQN